MCCELPSFIGGLNAFRSNNAKLIGVPLMDDGIDLCEFEKALKEHPEIKILYTIATFQNPSGITMSYEKRKEVIELSEKYDFIIFEDNPYGDLRFSGEEVPTLKSMDKYGRVVYFSSFSKIISPGLRLGYVCADSKLMERMIICKQVEDVHTNVLSQMIVYEFLNKYSIEDHIKKLRTVYKRRCDLMIECMDKYFPEKVVHTNPEGGLFIFCTMPKEYDSKEVMAKALEKGVAFVPGNTTMIDDKAKSNTFRMNYSNASEENIEKGVRLLGEVLHEIMD